MASSTSKYLSVFAIFAGALILQTVIFHRAKGVNSVNYVPSRLLDICKDQEYGSPREIYVTCCKNKNLSPGISFEKFWNECATPDESEGMMINVTLWRVYNCIVKKNLGSKPLTLENFALTMTESYPPDTKSSILEKVQKTPLILNEAQSEIENLKAVREAYYNIEIDACNKDPSVYRDKIMQMPHLKQLYTRGYDCLNSPVPISPKYYPLADDKDLVSTWTSILESVSVVDEKTHGKSIQHACELSSSWVAQKIISKDELFEKPNFQALFERVKPSWANTKVSKVLQEYVDKYWHSGPARDESVEETLEETAIATVSKFYEEGLKKEFVGIKDEAKAKALMISCSIPSFMKTSMRETFSYELCRLRQNQD